MSRQVPNQDFSANNKKILSSNFLDHYFLSFFEPAVKKGPHSPLPIQVFPLASVPNLAVKLYSRVLALVIEY